MKYAIAVLPSKGQNNIEFVGGIDYVVIQDAIDVRFTDGGNALIVNDENTAVLLMKWVQRRYPVKHFTIWELADDSDVAGINHLRYVVTGRIFKRGSYRRYFLAKSRYHLYGWGEFPITDNIDDVMVFHNYDDAFKALSRLPDNMWSYGKVCRVRYDFEEVEPCIDAQ